MILYLIHCRNDSGSLKQCFQMGNLKITYANRFCLTGFPDTLQRLPGIDKTTGYRPVDQIKIQIICT